MGYLQYKKEEKKALFAKVFGLKEKGKSHTQICEALTKEGVKQRNGGGWEPHHVTYILTTMGPKRRNGARSKQSKRVSLTAPVSKIVVVGIVNHPNLSDTQRVRMLSAYLSEM